MKPLTPARQKLVLMNLGLVGVILGDYMTWRNRHAWEDIRGVGMLALVEAAASYSPKRGVTFGQWAGKVIRWRLGNDARAQRRRWPRGQCCLVQDLASRTESPEWWAILFETVDRRVSRYGSGWCDTYGRPEIRLRHALEWARSRRSTSPGITVRSVRTDPGSRTHA